MKFSRIDNTLIGFFILVFISSIYLLVVVQNNQEHVSQALEIGTIKEVNNSVKKRHYTMLTWHNAAVTDALQEDDVIFTSENSSALLMFNDGSLLNIEGDSLIRLKGEHGIILEKGQIQINNEQSSDPSKLTITLAQKNNQKLTMGENSIFKLSKNNDNIEINSIKGNGSLSSQDNTSEIKNGQNFNIEKNKIKKINLS
ncbi:MAG: hypothetical protein Q7U04_16695, partial [Bacteriovorax sp.]|nr:hypothetical protein [Bacteriovorax sp.]